MFTTTFACNFDCANPGDAARLANLLKPATAWPALNVPDVLEGNGGRVEARWTATQPPSTAAAIAAGKAAKVSAGFVGLVTVTAITTGVGGSSTVVGSF